MYFWFTYKLNFKSWNNFVKNENSKHCVYLNLNKHIKNKSSINLLFGLSYRNM